ncbi:uncharacterized protein L3040_003089 [Drepanopeziza brunnea f. sp. 'multigermtubi']|uniref:Cell wall protein PhiA n=1 Tax=Marssonina brunnea f. sp. multigermtubi (strain MB_m1) TaxID=1072389 RepID=K1WMA8_MARBU|nr:cell wall protein PhiA [Drepanopeziza brunnea f. sp. 'multigermtubi' MB_m1]EKD18835.1 cell wall protein PhiA [Drepanopeziza brunnea f. sp. 'multigermtubi' MB_m1]KAJ5047250.1 hypothetical protein L3040_003089 [Drepanopeziza brunnea f. sp. 'multigermtubi']
MRFSASILGALSVAHLAAAAPIWGALIGGAASIVLPLLPSKKKEEPQPDTQPDDTLSTPQYFSLSSLKSGFAFDRASLSASSSNLYTNLLSQGASCENGDDPGFATLTIDPDRVLYLYTGSGPAQQFYVDRSKMGQGKLGYTTGDQSPPGNAESQGWELVDGILTFDGAGLIACPSNTIEDAWTVWVSSGNKEPGGNAGCTTFDARANYLAEGDLSLCTYTE